MKAKIHTGTPAKYILEELEARQLFSGGIEGCLPDDIEQNNAVHMEMDVNSEQNLLENSASTVSDTADNQIHELVFIDTDVQNYEQLLNDILTGVNDEKNIEVVLLDNQRDGIEQISETLANYKNLDAVHLISHGSDGNINLGTNQLNSETLNFKLSEISSWGDAFSEQGDFLIYGCNLAENEDGQDFIQNLSFLTRTDVAASDDLTGNKDLGGDWDLEYNTGIIETDIAISTETQQQWRAVLAETIYESNSNVNEDVEIKNSATWGQSFTHTSGSGTYSVNQISVELHKLATTVSQNIIITLSESWDGPILGSAVILSDDLTNVYSTYNFDFVDVELTDGMTYYIKLATNSESGKVYAGGDSTGGYANGFKINHGGNDVTGKDIAFAVKYSNNNFAATIGGNDNYSGNEGDMVSGTLTATDPEGLTDNAYFTVTSQPTNGTAVINTATGDWSFIPFDNNWFGTDSFNVTVTDDLGGTTIKVVTVSLANINDTAIVSSDSVNLTETNSTLTTNGILTSTDIDNPDNTFTANTIIGSIGTFNINAAGAWNFTANSAYDTLNYGDKVSETFYVSSIDGTSSTVQITINGTDEAITLDSVIAENTISRDSALPLTFDDRAVNSLPDNNRGNIKNLNDNLDADITVQKINSENKGASHVVLESQAIPITIFEDSNADENNNDTEVTVDINNKNSDEANYKIEKSDFVYKPELQHKNFENLNPQTNVNLNIFQLDNSIDSENLQKNIELMRAQMNSDQDVFEKQEVEIEIIMGATVSMTAGVINWVLRSGALLSSFLSSVSLFSQFDPLAVVSNNTKISPNPNESDQTYEHSNVEAMFDKKN